MKFKKRSVIIVLSMALAAPCYHIIKDIYKNGIRDGKANAHKSVTK